MKKLTNKEKEIIQKAIKLMEKSEDYSCFVLLKAQNKQIYQISELLKKYEEFFEKPINKEKYGKYSSSWIGLDSDKGFKEQRLLMYEMFLEGSKYV